MLWSTCVLAERRGAAADGFWKTEDVCVCHLFYYCARSGLCVRKHTEERRNAEEEEEGARCVLCVRRGVQEKMCVCVNAAETMARRVDARGQGIAGH